MKDNELPQAQYSIEFCHIYTNQTISSEHLQSVHYLREIVETLREGWTTYHLCAMVDDYSFPDHSFNYMGLRDWMKLLEVEPHFMIRESELLVCADEFLASLPDGKRKRALLSYIKRKRYPCSLLTAAWYLARLGKLPTTSPPVIAPATQLINILPRHLEPSEQEARRIIRESPFRQSLDVINNYYFELSS